MKVQIAMSVGFILPETSRDYFERSRAKRAKVIEKSKAALARRDAQVALARSSVRYTKQTPIPPS